jgi:hypothetical protein
MSNYVSYKHWCPDVCGVVAFAFIVLIPCLICRVAPMCLQLRRHLPMERRRQLTGSRQRMGHPLLVPTLTGLLLLAMQTHTVSHSAAVTCVVCGLV